MNNHKGSKKNFFICIEGQEFEWSKETITTEEIAELGEWEVKQGVIEVDKDNNERTLSPGEVIEIKPGHGFGKKICWKRGLLDDARIEEEISLLRRQYNDVQYKEENSLHWFLVEPIHLFDGWSPLSIPVVFYITEGHPGTQPYGFFVPIEAKFDNSVPKSSTTKNQPPFEGERRFISWQPIQWHPTDNILTGDNLWGWTRGFKHGLEI